MTIDGDMLLKIVSLAVSVGAGLYAWVMSQGKAAEHDIKTLREWADKEVASLRSEVAGATGRVSKIEGEMVHLPDKDMVHRIELGMKDMQSRIEAQAEVVKAVERTMQRVESFLLEAQSRPAPARRSK